MNDDYDRGRLDAFSTVLTVIETLAPEADAIAEGLEILSPYIEFTPQEIIWATLGVLNKEIDALVEEVA